MKNPVEYHAEGVRLLGAAIITQAVHDLRCLPDTKPGDDAGPGDSRPSYLSAQEAGTFLFEDDFLDRTVDFFALNIDPASVRTALEHLWPATTKTNKRTTPCGDGNTTPASTRETCSSRPAAVANTKPVKPSAPQIYIPPMQIKPPAPPAQIKPPAPPAQIKPPMRTDAKSVSLREVLNEAAGELELRSEIVDQTALKHTKQSGEMTWHYLRGVAAGLKVAATCVRAGVKP